MGASVGSVGTVVGASVGVVVGAPEGSDGTVVGTSEGSVGPPGKLHPAAMTASTRIHEKAVIICDAVEFFVAFI